MGLKILHSADWHLDSPFASFSPEQREALKQAQAQLPEQILEVCRREACDLVLLAGDVFDGSPSRETVETLKDVLAQFRVPVCVSPGNHDFCGPGSPWLEERWPENVHVFTGGMESIVLPELACRVYGAGYRSMDCPALLEDFCAEGEERFQVMVLHGDPVARNSPCCPITAAQVRDSGLHYLALGHIHRAGAFRAGDVLCAWPGCPMGRGWDETGDRGVCVVTLGEEPDIQAVSLDTVRFFDLEADIGDDAAAALEALLPPVGSGDFYRITLTGSGNPDVPGLRQRFSQFLNLELRDRTEEPIDLWAQAGEDSLRGMFFALLRDSQDPAAPLAAELAHKLLSGKEVPLP